MINNDESILLSQKVDENDLQAVLSQVLRIAMYDEMKAYEAYVKIIEKFGFVQPFVHIKESEARHYALLVPLFQKYGIEIPFNNWSTNLQVPDTFIECCELGVASEIKNIAMYDHLLTYIQEPDIKDVFYRLQAASYNNHLPAFRNCVIDHYNVANTTQGFNQDQIMEKMGEYQMILDDMLSGNVDQSKLTELFSKLNISMVGGAALGAAAIALLNNYINKEEE
ncbi:MAG: ferritin-like domain-containing protein [Halarcobacter sp.]